MISKLSHDIVAEYRPKAGSRKKSVCDTPNEIDVVASKATMKNVVETCETFNPIFERRPYRLALELQVMMKTTLDEQKTKFPDLVRMCQFLKP